MSERKKRYGINIGNLKEISRKNKHCIIALLIRMHM
jgi:hypothetical protein